MSLTNLFRNAKWSYKLIALSLPPLIVATAVASISVYFLISHSFQNIKNVEKVQTRQQLAGEVQNSIHNNQVNLISLVASADKQDIRTYAIASIKSFSIIDETIAGLLTKMPNNSLIIQLQEKLADLKPISMQVISFGKKNRDAEAMATMAENKKKYEEIQIIARQVLNAQQENFKDIATKSNEQSKTIGLTIAIIVLATCVLSIFIVWLTSRYLSNSLGLINQGVKLFSEGDLRVSDEQATHNDEIGQAKKTLDIAVNTVKQIVLGIRKETSQINTSSAALDKLSAINNESMNQIKNDIHMANDQISEIERLGTNIHEVLDTSNELTRAAANTSQSTSESITAGLTKLEILRENSRLVMEKNQGLAESTHKISDISQVIQSISEQTNLLALNAAIEAARAGEQGRGFAVVADEVRNLAYRSSEAVNQISNLAQEMTSQVESSVTIFNKNFDDLDDNISNFKLVANSAEESIKTSQDCITCIEKAKMSVSKQVGFIEQILSFFNRLESVTNNTQGDMQSLCNESEQLSTAAGQLETLVKTFKIGI